MNTETTLEQPAMPPLPPATGSAACPDFWIRYELKDGEEAFTTSRNMTCENVMEVADAIDRVKEKITAGDKWHCPNCDKPPNDIAEPNEVMLERCTECGSPAVNPNTDHCIKCGSPQRIG